MRRPAGGLALATTMLLLTAGPAIAQDRDFEIRHIRKTGPVRFEAPPPERLTHAIFVAGPEAGN